MSHFKIKHALFLSLILSGLLAFAQSSTFTANNGNWSVSGNWSNGVPTAGMTAIIGIGNSCTVNVSNAACSTLTLSGGNGETRLTISNGNTLSVSGTASISAPTTGNRTNAIIVAGSFSCAGLSLANTTNDNRDVELQMSGGTATISGNITMSGSSSRNALRFSSGGTVKVSGTVSGGTLVAGTGTMEFNNSGAQSISNSYTYNDITVSGSGTKTLGGALSINNLDVAAGTLSLSSNSLTVNGTTTIGGTLSDDNVSGTLAFYGLITVNGTWNFTVAQAVELRGGLTNNGTFNSGTGTYSFTTNDQALGGTMTFSGGILMTTASKKMTNNGNITVNGDLSAWNNSNEWVNAANSTLTVAADFLVTGILTATAAGNTIVYNNSSARVAKAGTYHHFTKSGAGSLTLNTLTINGTLTVNAGTFDASAYSVNVDCNGDVNGSGGEIKFAYSDFYIAGSFNYTGTITIPNASVYYDGGSQQVKGTTYYNLYIAGSGNKTLNGTTSVSNLLDISNGRRLALNGNTLNISNQLSGAGTIEGSATSSMNFTGNSFDISLSMNQSSSDSRSLLNITVDKPWRSVTLSNSLEVLGTVTVNNGTLASAGNLTLVSTASGDARIAELSLNQGSGVTGNVNVQKYIAAGSGRRWLHMGSPVSSFTWNQLIDDIFITGPAGQGFDVNGTFIPSAYTYTESTAGDCGPNGWVAAPTASSSTGDNTGLKIFYRGDRSAQNRMNGNNPPAPNASTLDFVGTIKSGAQNLNAAYTNTGNSTWDGWNFVANPYPSAIDWNAGSGWTKTNISGTVYVWNAQSGVYATWNGASGTNGMSNGRIAMGQGFWVKATAANPVLQMTEAVKTSAATTGFFKNNAQLSALRIKMLRDLEVYDELLFNFDKDYQREYDKQSGDALKMFNSSLNIWCVAPQGEPLAINNYLSEVQNDTIPLGMTADNSGIYTLEFGAMSLPAHLNVYLLDHYRGRVIDIRKEPSWKVLINEEPASYAVGRLELVFISQAAIKLDITAEANQVLRSTNIQWSSIAEMNTTGYEIEHSTDAVEFKKIGEISLNDVSTNLSSSYSFVHNTPGEGMNYYRVKRNTGNGFSAYSHVVDVNLEKQLGTGAGPGAQATGILAYPMPVMEKLNLLLPSSLNGKAEISIWSLEGRQMLSQTFSSFQERISLDMQDLPSGVYLLKVVSGSQQYQLRISKF